MAGGSDSSGAAPMTPVPPGRASAPFTTTEERERITADHALWRNADTLPSWVCAAIERGALALGCAVVAWRPAATSSGVIVLLLADGRTYRPRMATYWRP